MVTFVEGNFQWITTYISGCSLRKSFVFSSSVIECFLFIFRLHWMKKEDILSKSILSAWWNMYFTYDFPIDNNCAKWPWVSYRLLSRLALSDVGFVCVCVWPRRSDALTTQISLVLNTVTLTLLVTMSICFSFIPLIPGNSKCSLRLATALTVCNVIGQSLQVKKQVNE